MNVVIPRGATDNNIKKVKSQKTSKKIYEWSHKAHGKISISLTVRKMQIKSLLRQHFTLTRMAIIIIKKTMVISIGEDVRN